MGAPLGHVAVHLVPPLIELPSRFSLRHHGDFDQFIWSLICCLYLLLVSVCLLLWLCPRRSMGNCISSLLYAPGQYFKLLLYVIVVVVS